MLLRNPAFVALIAFIFLVTVTSAFAANTSSSSIEPVFDIMTLYGYCNSTSPYDTVTFDYEWFKNGVSLTGQKKYENITSIKTINPDPTRTTYGTWVQGMVTHSDNSFTLSYIDSTSQGPRHIRCNANLSACVYLGEFKGAPTYSAPYSSSASSSVDDGGIDGQRSYIAWGIISPGNNVLLAVLNKTMPYPSSAIQSVVMVHNYRGYGVNVKQLSTSKVAVLWSQERGGSVGYFHNVTMFNKDGTKRQNITLTFANSSYTNKALNELSGGRVTLVLRNRTATYLGFCNLSVQNCSYISTGYGFDVVKDGLKELDDGKILMMSNDHKYICSPNGTGCNQSLKGFNSNPNSMIKLKDGRIAIGSISINSLVGRPAVTICDKDMVSCNTTLLSTNSSDLGPRGINIISNLVVTDEGRFNMFGIISDGDPAWIYKKHKRMYLTNPVVMKSGIEYLISTLTSGEFPFSGGDEIEFSCRASDINGSGSWLNSSIMIPLVSSSISPTPAYSNDTLEGSCNVTDFGNNFTFYYRWYLNGQVFIEGHNLTPVTSNATILVSSIPPINTTQFQNWTFACKASSEEQNTIWVNSSSLIISNYAPISTAPILNQTAYSESILTCYKGNSSDADNDSLTDIFRWYVNGNLTAYQTQTLNLETSGIVINDVVSCAWAVNDSYETSGLKNSSEITVLNRVPEILSVMITPDEPTDAQDLTAYCTPEDADGQNLTLFFYWYNTDNLSEAIKQGNYTNVSIPYSVYQVDILAKNYSEVNDYIRFSCIAYDGYNYSLPGNSTVRIREVAANTGTVYGSGAEPQGRESMLEDAKEIVLDIQRDDDKKMNALVIILGGAALYLFISGAPRRL